MPTIHPKFCVQCGNELGRNFKACPSCGGREFSDAPVTTAREAATQPTSRIHSTHTSGQPGSIPTSGLTDTSKPAFQPGNIANSERYAGFWIRAGAYAVDTLVVMVLLLPFFLIWGFQGVSEFRTPGQVFFQEALIPTLLYWVYFALMESSKLQATLGKRAFGLKVVGIGGERIGFGRATGRYFAKIVSGLLLMAGYLMVAFTEKKQGLHDMMASTFVLRS